MLPEQMSRWIREREPKSEAELTTLMQTYSTYYPEPKKEARTQGQLRKELQKTSSWSNKKLSRETRPAPTKQEIEKVTCYKCQKKGHYARDCRQETFVMEEKRRALSRFRCTGTINKGQEVEMRLDSGCTRTTVRKDLIPKELLKTGRSEMTIANGALLGYGLADITLTVDDQEYPLEATVAEELAVPVLLRADLPLES